MVHNTKNRMKITKFTIFFFIVGISLLSGVEPAMHIGSCNSPLEKIPDCEKFIVQGFHAEAFFLLIYGLNCIMISIICYIVDNQPESKKFEQIL